MGNTFLVKVDSRRNDNLSPAPRGATVEWVE
jgi:hypothetical protein